MNTLDIHNIVINTSEKVDPLTNLQSLTHYGRPNFGQLLDRVKGELRTRIKVDDPTNCEVGVFFCGPYGLGYSVQRSCISASDSAVKFKFYEEHF
jgi:NADPH oxidase